MQVTYANCLLGGLEPGDLLATNEPLVAASARVPVIVPDAHFDADEAQALNERMFALGFNWPGDPDPTVVDAISAADLGGVEATQTILLPAVRGVLEADAILAEARPSRLVTAVAASGDAVYTRVERILCAAVATTLRARLGTLEVEEQQVVDAGNAALVAKYVFTRNPPSPAEQDAGRQRLLMAAAAAVNAAARLREPRRRESVLMVEYGPTTVVARRWHRLAPPGAPALVRSRFAPADLRPMLRHGERAFAYPRARPGEGAARVAAALRSFDPGQRFVVRGVDLAPIVLPELAALAVRYARWAEDRVRATRRCLRRHRVRALLVPFDGQPIARALLRAAQAEGIPTAALNDGWKGDDHQPDGMTADRAFALSESVRDSYFSRRHDPADVVVTGDPRNDGARAPRGGGGGGGGDVLVGSLTFSGSDLNCRRGDPERFLDEVLAGIAGSRLADRRVTFKLHPADSLEHYASVLGRHAGLDVRVVTTGDVLDMIPGAAVYVTTYSTSLLSAALAGTPFVYYRVNEQKLHAPFSDDAEMDARTAATPERLAALLDAPPGPVAPEWVERYVGPRDGGNARRVIDALLGLAR